jgi:hypothetical protein
MKAYLIWYRLKGDKEDRIRGVARNWSKAENLAENLAFYLRLSTKEEFEYGVKSYLFNKLPYDLESDDGCFGRWGPTEFGEE